MADYIRGNQTELIIQQFSTKFTDELVAGSPLKMHLVFTPLINHIRLQFLQCQTLQICNYRSLVYEEHKTAYPPRFIIQLWF